MDALADITRGIKYATWVRSKARKVDTKDFSLVKELADIMTEYRNEYAWNAVAHNNIYWDLTTEPLRVIQVPHPDRNLEDELDPENYITIINPAITVKGKNTIFEACGSIGEPLFAIQRHKSLKVTGYILEEGEEQTYFVTHPVIIAMIKHEVDHLDAILISDIGPVVEFNSKMEHEPFIILNDFMHLAWEEVELYQTGNRFYLFDNNLKPHKALNLILRSDGGNMFWSAIESIDYHAKKDIYGPEIVITLPNTLLVQKSIQENPSNYTSPYGFFKIPLS